MTGGGRCHFPHTAYRSHDCRPRRMRNNRFFMHLCATWCRGGGGSKGGKASALAGIEKVLVSLAEHVPYARFSARFAPGAGLRVRLTLPQRGR